MTHTGKNIRLLASSVIVSLGVCGCLSQGSRTALAADAKGHCAMQVKRSTDGFEMVCVPTLSEYAAHKENQPSRDFLASGRKIYVAEHVMVDRDQAIRFVNRVLSRLLDAATRVEQDDGRYLAGPKVVESTEQINVDVTDGELTAYLGNESYTVTATEKQKEISFGYIIH